MGYSVDVREFDIKLKKGVDIDKLEEEIKLNREKWGGFLFDVRIYKQKSAKSPTLYWLELDDYYGKIPEMELFFEFITPYVEEGYIEIRGEEGEQWCHVFKDGDWAEKDGVTFFGFEAYEKFIECYGEELPKKIKEDLEQWWIAKKI